MKKTKTHRGQKRYANLQWWQWQDINECNDRARRMKAKSIDDKFKAIESVHRDI